MKQYKQKKKALPYRKTIVFVAPQDRCYIRDLDNTWQGNHLQQQRKKETELSIGK